jgi:hypothetical protein
VGLIIEHLFDWRSHPDFRHMWSARRHHHFAAFQFHHDSLPNSSLPFPYSRALCLLSSFDSQLDDRHLSSAVMTAPDEYEQKITEHAKI